MAASHASDARAGEAGRPASVPRMPAPDLPPLASAAVDVVRADLRGAHARERALLSDDERARAARFVRPGDGERWAAARGILRALLGAATGEDPRELRFALGEHGKPRLAGRAGADGATQAARAAAPDGGPLARVRFNLSHAGDVALYALTLDREVGVDVELPREREVDQVAIARRVLGDAEAQRLAALDPPQREREFLRLWVRWEAVIKCRGTGIGGADAPAAGPEAGADAVAAGPQPWVAELDVDPPAAAALAVAGGPATIRQHRWIAAAS